MEDSPLLREPRSTSEVEEGSEPAWWALSKSPTDETEGFLLLNIEEDIIRRRGRHEKQEVEGKVERMTDQVWKKKKIQSIEGNRQEGRCGKRGKEGGPTIPGSVHKQNSEGRVKPNACFLPLE